MTNPPPTQPGTLHRRSKTLSLLLFITFVLILITTWNILKPAPEPALVESAYRASRFDEAQASLTRWLARQPNSEQAWLWQARLGLALGKPKNASDALLKAESLQAPADQALLVRQIAAALAGQFAEAEPALRAAFNRPGDPPDPLLSEALARIYLESYDFPRAAIVLARWKREAPANPKPFLWSAEVNLRTNKPDEALADYRAALEQDPQSKRGHLGLADALREAKKLDEAALAYTDYLKLAPNDPQGHYGAGCVAADLGRMDEALAQLQQSISLNPNLAGAYYRIADLHIRQTRFDEALKHLEQARQIDPFDLETRNSLAVVLNQLGKTDEAKTEVQTARQLRQELDALLAAQARLVKAPKERESQLVVMRWMFTHGKPAEGVRWGEAILKGHPFDAVVCSELADHYEKSGNPGLANSYRAMARPKP